MRFIKLFLISAVVLSGVTTFLFILFPSDIRISRVIMISGNRERIAAAIDDLRTWDKWNLFINRPAMTHLSFSSPSKGAGAYLQSDQLRVELTGTAPDSVKTHWERGGASPFNSSINIIEQTGGGVVVQWNFDFHFRWFPWEKLGSMFYDRRMGPLMEESLLNLKRLVENNP